MSQRLLRFSTFRLDLGRLCLAGPAGEIQLRPKSFEVLLFLLKKPGQVATFLGRAGSNYIFETSTNLIHWTPFRTNSASNGIVTIAVTNPPAPRRFYRAR